MAMTAQDWQEIELRHQWREIESEQNWREIESKGHRTRPRKTMNPMVYPAILSILGVIGTLVLYVYAIRTVNQHVEHLPHRHSVNMKHQPQED
jgi:hypothetical protein